MALSSSIEEIDDSCEDIVNTALTLCVLYSRYESDKRELARGLREISILIDKAAEREDALAKVALS